MKTVILGAGQVGFHVAKYLSEENHMVSVVESNPQLALKFSDELDARVICGFASHPEVLEQAGIQEADCLVAVTHSDEVNMIACEVAQCLYQTPLKIARIRSPSYLQRQEKLFVPSSLSVDAIISPEIEIAHSIYESEQIHGTFYVSSCRMPGFRLIGVRCQNPSPLLKTPLQFLRTIIPHDLTVILIKRDLSIFFPKSTDEIQLNDEVYFLLREQDIPVTMAALGYSQSPERRVLIIGGGYVGVSLAREFEQNSSQIAVTLIENNSARCEEIQPLLNQTLILNGDSLDPRLLEEANYHDCDTILAVTQDDTINIISSLFAKTQNIHKTVCLLNNAQYIPLVSLLGVDSIMNVKNLTTFSIVKHTHQFYFDFIHSLEDYSVIVVEKEVQEHNHQIVGLSARDLRIEDSVYLAALTQGANTFFTPSDQVMQPGNQLIIVCRRDYLKKIEKLFR
jgi:trk system potassium uptake protein TrkA